MASNGGQLQRCGGGAAAAAVAAAAAAATTDKNMAVVPFTVCGAPEGKGCEEAMLASSAPDPYMARCKPADKGNRSEGRVCAPQLLS